MTVNVTRRRLVVDFLPIPLGSIIAVVFVVGFLGWTVFWDDRREVNRLDSLIEDFDEDDEEIEIEFVRNSNGRHAKRAVDGEQR